MKKYNRQRLILDLIESNEVKTQEDLSALLNLHGLKATQATISRDIKELRISKVQTESGDYKYTVMDSTHDSMNDRIHKIFRSSVLSIHPTDTMIIIQTIAYTATVCGLAITNEKFDGVAGIITGHDTIFIAVHDPSRIKSLIEDIKEMMH